MDEITNKECTIPESELFSREYVLSAVTRALINVSKDLYNLGLDDLSKMAISMGDICVDNIDERKDELVYPREPNQPPVNPKAICDCGCKPTEVKTDGMSNIEEEVSGLVDKIRSEQSKEN